MQECESAATAGGEGSGQMATGGGQTAHPGWLVFVFGAADTAQLMIDRERAL